MPLPNGTWLRMLTVYFDALTLAAITDELRETILGGRIQRVMLTGPLSIGLEIYARGQRHQLLASAHPQLARVQLVRGKLTRGVEQVSPLLLLLRKYVLGGRLIGIEQPALERTLLLSIVKAPDMRNRDTEDEADPSADELELESALSRPRSEAELLRCELVIEPQDRRSNIMLVDDNNLILDSIKRVKPSMSSRVVLPRQVYELPPPPDKRDPTRATAAEIAALGSAGEQDLARALVAAYRGVSPQVAREVVFRALGRVKARLDEPLPHYSLAARLREIFSAPPAPCLVADADGPLAYAPYAITHLPEAKPAESTSAALETFYSAREALTSHSQRRAALAQQLAAARERLARQHDQITAELTKARELERLRWEGEMLFAFLHELRPGQTILLVEGKPITLDPGKSPVEQAQERFRQYDKAKSAIAGLPERLNTVALRLQGLDELTALLHLSDEFDQIEQIGLEAEELGYLREQPDPTAQRRRARGKLKAQPLQLVSSDGFALVVGRSARQNEDVTFRIGQRDDLWVHAHNIHGAHVIIRSGGREPPERTIVEAAGLAAYFSQSRAETAVEVDICRRALVRKVPAGPPGLVTYRAERTLRVAPRPPW